LVDDPGFARRITEAMKRPGYCEQLKLLGVVVFETMRAPGVLPGVDIPPENEPRIRVVVDEALGDEPPPRASRQGTWEGKAFTPAEVDKVAAICMKNPALTSWEVWTRYRRVRAPDDDGRLGSSRKVADLVALLDDNGSGVTWDAGRKRVRGLARSLREPGRVLIPRSKSAS
jgi:hypothetical protein